MTARDVTGFYALSLPGTRANFSTFWGEFPTKLHRKHGEKGEKSAGDNSNKSSGDGALKLQISVSCRGQMCPDNGAQYASSCLSHAYSKSFLVYDFLGQEILNIGLVKTPLLVNHGFP